MKHSRPTPRMDNNCSTLLPPAIDNHLARADHRIRQMLAYWCSIRNGRLAPLKQHFDPIAVPRLLKHVSLYEYDPSSGDFICRLAGEHINHAWGASIRGRMFREVVGAESHNEALGRWMSVLTTPLVQYGTSYDTHHGVTRQSGERLVLPLLVENPPADGSPAGFVLTLSIYLQMQVSRDTTPPVWKNMVQVPCTDLMMDRIG